MKPAESSRTSDAYLHGLSLPDGAAGQRAESRRGDREEHETCLPAQQPSKQTGLVGL